MSANYGLHCLTCNVDSPEWFQTVEQVRTLVQAWPTVRGLLVFRDALFRQPGIQSILFDVTISWLEVAHDPPYPDVFMQVHGDHVLRIRDEYGHSYGAP